MPIGVIIPFKKSRVKNTRKSIRAKPKAHKSENWTQTIYPLLVNPKRRKYRHRPHGINNLSAV